MKRRLSLFMALVLLFTICATMLAVAPAYATQVRPAIAVGNSYMIALKDDGTVWSWGYNNFGQLGDGSTIDRTSPVHVSGLSGVIGISAGNDHAAALTASGNVWKWGCGGSGQMGDGFEVSHSTPIQVPGLSDVVAVACGNSHTLALRSDGTVYSWGTNSYGELGDGTTVNRLTPVQVSGLSDVSAIAAGNVASFALKTDGSVWAWGSNWGHLGDGTEINRSSPVQVLVVAGAVAIASNSQDSAYALSSDGSVWSWGYNPNGELGNGTTTNSLTPALMPNLTGVTQISAGGQSASATLSDGSVRVWGRNQNGQLGDTTTANRIVPIVLTGQTDLLSICMGHSSAFVQANGTVWTAGGNTHGQLGYWTNGSEPSHQFLQIPDFTLITTPGVPSSLTAMAGDTQVSLSWTAVGNATSYSVKRSTTSGGPYTVVAASVVDEQYVDTGLTNGTTYYYVVSASNGTGEGPDSAEASAIPSLAAPTAPTDLAAIAGDAQVSLSWTAVGNATSYSVKRATISGGSYTVVAASVVDEQYVDTGLTNGTTYYYVVSAGNGTGEGPDSAEASATPSLAAPTVPIGLAALGEDKTITLYWTASAGATSYIVQRSEIAGGPYVTVATIDGAATYADSDVVNGTTYYYVVRAMNASGQSDASNEASATPVQVGGDHALLVITLTTGAEKEYELTAEEVATFIEWYDGRAAGSGKAYYIFDKTYNKGPFLSRKDYISYEAIASFEVMDFNR